jgi:hypothetical protein
MNINRLMLFKVIIVIYSESHKIQIYSGEVKLLVISNVEPLYYGLMWIILKPNLFNNLSEILYASSESFDTIL